MTIEAVSALASSFAAAPASGMLPSASTAAPEGAFDALVRSLQDINEQMTINKQSIESIAAGQGDELHRVIMNLESTKLAFDLALQVRNKVLDAYQELMRMQV